MSNRIILLALVMWTMHHPLSAQNLTAPLLAGSWQSTYHNPAMVHFLPATLTVGLPGIANDLRLQNLAYGDLFSTAGSQRVLNLTAWSDVAQATNLVEDVYSVETLGLAYRKGRFGFSLHHRLRVQGQLEYPKSLIDLVARGNASLVGRTVEIAPRGMIVSYQEVGAGVSFAVTDRIAVGGRIKYLSGVSNVKTAGAESLRLTTGEENFALNLEQNFILRSVNVVSYQALDRFTPVYNPYRLKAGDLATGNSGLAVDLGIAVHLDRLKLNLSVADLGAGIEWSENVTTLNFSGSDTFTGLDILADLLRDTVSLGEAVDSLAVTFEPTRGEAAYRTEIGAAYFLGGEYAVTDRLTAGAMLFLENRLGEPAPAYALVGRYAVTDWLRVGINLNHRSGVRTNLGLHLLAEPGRFQIFASSDKLFTLLGSGSTSLAGVRLGAALSLGERNRSSSSFLPEYR